MMKLIRYGDARCERPGLIDDDGQIRDLSGMLSEISAEALHPYSLVKLRNAVRPGSLPLVKQSVRYGACVGNPSKIICVGLNYFEHVREVNQPVPAEPVIFMKAPSALSGPFDDIVIPPGAQAVDWEVELGVIIGSRTSRVMPEHALSHIAGYCIVNDISERNWQLQGAGQWVKGKSADTFAPIGPWLVTCDEIQNPQQLSLKLAVNGVSRQSGNTSDMVFGVRHLVSYISGFMTLLPGDIISTGTPPGVGMGQRPPRYLQAGDLVEVTIEGLGSQSQLVVASEN